MQKKQEQKPGVSAPGDCAEADETDPAKRRGSGGFAFVQFVEGPFGLLQEEEAEEGHDQTGHAQDLEEGTVGGSDHLRGGFAATAHPHRQEAENGEVGHSTDVAVGTDQAGHLTGDATLHQRHERESGAFAGLDEEGGQHRDHHGHDDPGGAGEAARFDHAHDQVAHTETGGEEAHGVLAAADAVGDQTAGRTGHQVHKSEAGGQNSSGGLRQIEGGFKEGGQHRDHRQFGSEVHDVGELQNRHLAELVAVFLGIHLGAQDQLAVGADDAPSLESEPDGDGTEGQGVGARSEESNFREAPTQHTEDGCEGHVHAQQTPEVAHGSDFKASGPLRTLIRLARGCVGDVEEVEHAIDGGDDAGQSDGTAPVQYGTRGQFETTGEGEEAGKGHHREGGEGRTEVAPTAVDAFSKADFLGREPFSHHADADHEAGTDDGEQQTGHHQLVEVLSGGKQQAGNRREDQDRGVGDPGSEFVQEHADQHAGRDGEGHVADGHGTDLTDGQSEVRFYGGGQWSQVEPDDERQEKGNPGEMKSSISPLERPEVAKHEKGKKWASNFKKAAFEV